jgi:hypothetical protein
MPNRTRFPLSALSLAFLLACGTAHAQLKPPTKSPLGGGLGSQRVPKPPAEPKAASPDEVVQNIANCVLAGLPPDWQLAQIEVTELSRDGKQREFEAKYLYTGKDGKGAGFTPCDLREPALNVYKLNAALDPEKRNWIKATLVLSREGKFELQYDYAKKDGDAQATPAPTSAPAPASTPAQAPSPAPTPDPNYDPTRK